MQRILDTMRLSHVARLLPLYIAAYSVLLCSLAAYIQTNTDDVFGPRSLFIIFVGMGVSMFCRLRQWRQNTMFGILAGMVVVLIFWVSVSGASPMGQMMMYLANGRNTVPGLMLAWFLTLYSFAMIADEVIIFSVVPSIALLGLMASENLNPEMVVYFLGLVLSAVFLLVYENVLSRMPEEAAAPELEQPARTEPDKAALLEPDKAALLEPDKARPDVRASLMLAVVVMAVALVTGLVASMPLQSMGRTISDHTPRLNMPAAMEFASEATSRYINQLQLSGAPPHLSDRVVMEVRTPEPFYWRGKVFTEYTGSSWTGDQGSQPLTPLGRGYWDVKELNEEPDKGEAKARRRVRQFVQTFDPPIGGMIVAAGEPSRVRANLAMSQDRYRSIRAVDTRSNTNYTVESLVSEATPEQLRNAGNAFPVALRAVNTQLYSSDPVRLEIARRITAGQKTQYGKVKALEHYLQTNFSYTLTPPRTPSTEDAVTFFLTQSKQGYCEIFASSMAVLARELGIPARLATGFAPGTWRTENGPGRWGVSVVREKDLHAWTEVYFPGYGWVPFDPTSSREAEMSFTASVREYVSSLFAQISTYSVGPMLVLVSMLGIVAFLVKTYGLDPLWSSSWWRALLARYRKNVPVGERWSLAYTRAHRRIAKLAGGKKAHQTAFEYADQARALLPPDAAAVFDDITRLYVHTAFGPQDPTDADFATLERLGASLQRALKAAPARAATARA